MGHASSPWDWGGRVGGTGVSVYVRRGRCLRAGSPESKLDNGFSAGVGPGCWSLSDPIVSPNLLTSGGKVHFQVILSSLASSSRLSWSLYGMALAL